MGTEEIDTIIPVLNELRAQGMKLQRAAACRYLFQPKYLDNADAVLAMYHDQGSSRAKIPGLRARCGTLRWACAFIRHQWTTAPPLELAGRGKADVGSFITALNLAIKMIVNTQ